MCIRDRYELIKLLVGPHRNLYCVADEDQCMPGTTLVSTVEGPQPIATLAPQTPIRIAAGRSATMVTDQWEPRSRPYEGQVVSITTQRGYSLSLTPNHMMFALSLIHIYRSNSTQDYRRIHRGVPS